MKIRGNAHHVAEKYLQLARDAHTSGDPVAAENYLQHAEHYFRLIAAAQAAQLQAQNGAAGRPPGEGEVDENEDDDDGGVLADRFASPSERAPPVPYNPPQPPYAPQPNVGNGANPPYGYAERQPYESERPHQQDRNFQPRQDRQQNRNQDRGPRQDRPYQDRQDNNRDSRPNNDGRREFRPYREPNPQRDAPQPSPEGAGSAALPSFITSAPRISGGAEEGEAPPPMNVDIAEGAPEQSEAQGRNDAPGEGRFPSRGRRRRLRSPYGFHASTNGDGEPSPSQGSDETPVAD